MITNQIDTAGDINSFSAIDSETEMRDLARVTPEELMDLGDTEDIRPPRDNAAAWARWGAKMTFLRAIHAEIAPLRAMD
jgi:hypothetical protein